MPAEAPGENPYRQFIDDMLRQYAQRHGEQPWSAATIAAEKAIVAVENQHNLGPVERLHLRQQLLDDMAEQLLAQCPIHDYKPKYAPELWAERKGRKENPPAFVRRVYARWLGRGISRGDLRTIDPPLYQALAVWIHRHPDETMPELTSPMQRLGEEFRQFFEQGGAGQAQPAQRRRRK